MAAVSQMLAAVVRPLDSAFGAGLDDRAGAQEADAGNDAL